MNCFHFTYEYLLSRGFEIPKEWNNLKYETEYKKIEENPKYYLDTNLIKDYFNSFTQLVNIPQKNDIILHNRGVGIALNETQFVTINHIKKIIVKPIQKYHTVRRVNG